MINDDFNSLPDLDNAAPATAFVIDIDGYEGPIDVLLSLARNQKVDLAQISILQLADQYLSFVAEARRISLNLAADYLVMAAWLAYLKSKLLLPELAGGDEPSGEEMASALAFQMRRLQSMQKAGEKLMERGRLGRDFFPRGEIEKFIDNDAKTVFEVSLYDLLKAYGDQKSRKSVSSLHIEPSSLYTVEESLARLRHLLGSAPDWQSLMKFLPAGLVQDIARRSAVASTFAASLELVREGMLKLRQSGPFEPIYVRSAKP